MFRQLLLSLRITLQNFIAAKLRTSLTILGIVIGVAAVTIVMSVGASAQALILDQIRGIGSNLIAVLPGASEETGPPASVFGVVETSFTTEDFEEILDDPALSYIEAGSGYVTGSATVEYRSTSVEMSFQGVSPDMINVENATIEKGRFFSEREDDRGARVAVLGHQRAVDLFGTTNPVGKTIKIAKQKFTVIGVLEKRGALLFFSPDEQIFMPLTTAQNRMLGIDHLNFARFKIDSEENAERAKADIREILRDRHDLDDDEEDDFSVRAIQTALSLVTNITDAMTFFLVSVAAVSLVVGGIGIMNIMLIVLSQRVREVGLRKALGARSGDIMVQFAAESIFIALIGGLMGFALGVLITFFIAIGAQAAGYNWTFLLTPESAFVAFAVSVVTGLVFGIYPARKAAKVSPMEALRYE